MTSASNKINCTSRKRIWIAAILCVSFISGLLLLLINKNSDEKTMKITTEYCTFLYPAKWEDNLRVEESNGCVMFYSLVEGQNEVPLFKFDFGSGDGALMGAIQTKTGERVNVYMTTYPLPPEGVWSKNQLETIYAMGEDLNVLLEHLALVEIQATLPEPSEAIVYEDLKIDTPYGTLYYPGNWQNLMCIEKTEGEPFVVRICYQEDGEKLAVCEVYLSREKEGALGQFMAEDGTYVYVSVHTPSLDQESDWPEKKQNQIYAMRDSVNHLLKKLNLEEIPEETVPETSPEVYDDIVIETAYAELRFPGKWQGMIHAEKNKNNSGGYTVKFYGIPGEIPLFDVSFGVENEHVVGALAVSDESQIPIGIVMYPVEDGTMLSMQEDVNYLVNCLNLQAYETEPESGVQDDNQMSGGAADDDFIIVTPYAELKYPAKWKEITIIEIHEDQTCQVVFYRGMQDSREHLFTVIFGDVEGNMIGTVSGPDGTMVPVTVEIANDIESAGLPEDIKNEIYAMQDDINYLISHLPLA